MTSTVQPPPVGVPTAPIVRTFAADPFHTDGDLLALAFAADGTLWSVEEPGVLRRWELNERRQLDWHPLEELATLWSFSGDGRLLAAGSNDLSVWETDNGDMQATWTQPSWVTALAFHPDGRILASGHDDGSIRLWDWESQELLRLLDGHPMPISALAFSHDGRTLASAGEDRVIRLWDAVSGGATGRLTGHSDRIPALAWVPGCRRLVSAGWDTTARIWDADSCEPVILLNSHAGQVHTLALNADGSRLACADSAHAVHLWDLHKNRSLEVLRPQGGEVRCLAFGPGDHLASGGAERVIHIHDPRHGSTGDAAIDPLLSRTGLAVTQDGRRLTHLSAGTRLRLWDVTTGQRAAEPQVKPPLHTCAAAPDGNLLVVSLADRDRPERTPARLVLLDGAGKRRAMLQGPSEPVTALAVSPDGATFASGSYQSSDIWIWNARSGEPSLILPNAVEGCSVEHLLYHPQGRLLAVSGVDWLATSGVDGQVAVWDLVERRLRVSFPGGATGLAFHPSGRLLAVASLIHTVRVWDLEGQPLASELLGHLDAVTCVAYSPDGRWLASGGDDHTVRLWDAVTGAAVGVAELDTQVKAVVFSPDGRSLFTGNGNASCYQLEVARLQEDFGERPA